MPSFRPVRKLPAALARYEEAARELPERLKPDAGGARDWITEVFRDVDDEDYQAVRALSHEESQTCMLIMSLLGHAFRWNSIPALPSEFERTRITLPRHLDNLWSQVAREIGQLRVASFWNTNLCNWTLTDDPDGTEYKVEDLNRDNVRLLYNWLPEPYDRDAEVFMRVFILAEAHGTKLVEALMRCIESIGNGDCDSAADAIDEAEKVFGSFHRLYAQEIRSGKVRPSIWPTHIQPFFGWNVETKEGVLGGPSGMNLGCFQVLNSFLGITESEIAAESHAYRCYMPPPHRAFLTELDATAGKVREAMANSGHRRLVTSFNDLAERVTRWRVDHARRGAVYVQGASTTGTHLPQTSTGKTLSGGVERAENYVRTMMECAEETRAAKLETPETAAAQAASRLLKIVP